MDFEQSKKWYQSRGIVGALAAGAAGVWGAWETIHAFVNAHPDMERGIGEAIRALANDPTSLIVIFGSFFAWFGRWKATEKISNDRF